MSAGKFAAAVVAAFVVGHVATLAFWAVRGAA